MHAITVRPTETADAKGRRRPGPENLEWTEVPTPRPGPGEVLVKVRAAGMNRADLLQRQGLYPPPRGVSEIMGFEVVGTIAELGPEVSGWQEGDEVVALLAGGGYAEYALAPAGQLLHMPSGVDPVVAPTPVGVAGTRIAHKGNRRVATRGPNLVHGGAGGVGQFAIQYAKGLGCTVATTCGTEDKRAFCRDLGADIALDYHQDWAAEFKEATGGHGADVILDVMGAAYLGHNVDSLATGGRLVIIGMQGGTRGELNIGKLLSKRGLVTATSLRFRPAEEKAAICRRVEELAWPMYADGRITPAPVETFELPDAAAAHARLESGQVLGKIALTL
ncbi:MAG: NAD(P)H-quinone oxidoreductase [Acidipropionibacterium jensenii]|uniref:NAD(P)H-quinone oxidoreductase n=1 Tax=Acidipropionibacterium jensenii TaxID=1749 RepID=UPI002649E6FB|nr:NAD(P)H-quinone oxidoreductase [Acidipropionibacterium jensenii]MDN6481141.1 NAD(P)H-quinone oxidoreductase [Acidipropionibacterium jensenii]